MRKNMPKIYGYSLPGLVRGKLWATVSEFGDAAYEPSCGTVVTEGSTVKSLQEQMIATIQTEDEFSQPLLEVLQTALYLTVGAVEALSQKMLIQCFDGLCHLFGRTELLLAMLVDTRTALRAFAAEQLEKEAGITVGLSEGAQRRLKTTLLQPLHELLTRCHGNVEVPCPNNEIRLTRKAAALENEVKQLKKSRKRRVESLTEQMQRLTQEKDRAIQHMQQEHSTIQSELQRVLTEKADLQKRLEEQHQQIEQLVEQEVETRTNSINKKWLALPLQTEKDVHAERQSSDELLHKAEAVLETQTAQDQHTGNRLQLQARLDQLVAMKNRLSGAAQSAIVCIPQVVQTNQEVDHAISKIRKVLGAGLASDPISEALLIRINRAGSTDEMYECAAMVKSMEALSLIQVADCWNLYDGLHRRYSLLDEKAGAPQPFKDTGWSLRGIIHRNEPCLLLLDGHNLLFRLTDVFGDAYENGVPGTKARGILVNTLKALAVRRSNLQVKVCFDGPHKSARKEAENIEVAFSGGEGENRADNLLLGYLPLARSTKGNCFGVTDDGAVREQLTCSGATYVPCSLFAVLLRDFGCLHEPQEQTK